MHLSLHGSNECGHSCSEFSSKIVFVILLVHVTILNKVVTKFWYGRFGRKVKGKNFVYTFYSWFMRLQNYYFACVCNQS